MTRSFRSTLKACARQTLLRCRRENRDQSLRRQKLHGGPSHPAFSVTGQLLGAGNHRAFATLAHYRDNGASRGVAIDCCGGSCANSVCGSSKGP